MYKCIILNKTLIKRKITIKNIYMRYIVCSPEQKIENKIVVETRAKWQYIVQWMQVMFRKTKMFRRHGLKYSKIS